MYLDMYFRYFFGWVLVLVLTILLKNIFPSLHISLQYVMQNDDAVCVCVCVCVCYRTISPEPSQIQRRVIVVPQQICNVHKTVVNISQYFLHG